MTAAQINTPRKIYAFHANTEKEFNDTEFNSPKHNELLAGLPQNDYVQLLANLELYYVQAEENLHEAGMPFEWIYFPTTAVICIGYITESGSMPSVGLVGKDGLVGLPCIMGSDHATCYATVQTSGLTYRIKAHHLKKELYKKDALLQMVLLYSQIFFTQISQTAVCNRLHTVDQQLCRYLLMNADLLEQDDLYLTHECIANMLGVRREGITHSAGKLQQQKFISYSRGKIKIINKKGLMNEVCECYDVVKKEKARLIPNISPFGLSCSLKTTRKAKFI